jgi:hypothetical protein
VRAFLIPLIALSGCIVVHGDRDDRPRYDACAWSDECASDEVCNAGVCDYAFGLEYEVVITSARAGEVHPDGAEWDPEGGLPDLLVSFGVEDDICVTTTVPDTLSADWTEGETVDGYYCEFFVDLGDVLYLEVYDEDHDDYELGASWAFDTEEAMLEVLRSDGLSRTEFDETDTVSVSYYVVPW